MSKHVVRVAHNLKGGGEADLTQKTLIVGPNGSGKSALVNAVELALTGKASDIAGRDVVAQGAALASLANGTGAWAKVDLSDGSKASWEIGRKGDRVTKAKRTGTVGVMPLREVIEELTGGADRARKFLLQHVCDGLDNSDIVSKLDTDQLSRYQRLTDSTLTPIENLLAVSALAGKKGRETKKKAEGARDAEDAAAAGLGAQPTQAELAAAESAMTSTAVALAQATAVVTKLNQGIADPRRQIVVLRSWVLTAQADKATLDARLLELPVGSKEQARDTLRAVMTLMQTKWTEGPCLACGNDFDREAWKDYRDHVEEVCRQGDAKSAGRAEQRDAITAQLASLHQRILLAEQEIQALERLPAVQSTMTMEEALAAQEAAVVAQEEAHTTFVGLRETHACWERVSRSIAVRRDNEREERGWSHLATVCTTIILELVADAVTTFSARVQRYLPKGEKFSLHLGTSTVRYGLIREGEVHTALSGAEWARVSAALAAACTPEEADVPLLVPEDRAWDAKTLRSVLQGLTEYRGQVLMATTVKPYRGVPAGWTLVEVGE